MALGGTSLFTLRLLRIDLISLTCFKFVFHNCCFYSTVFFFSYSCCMKSSLGNGQQIQDTRKCFSTLGLQVFTTSVILKLLMDINSTSGLQIFTTSVI